MAVVVVVVWEVRAQKMLPASRRLAYVCEACVCVVVEKGRGGGMLPAVGQIGFVQMGAPKKVSACWVGASKWLHSNVTDPPELRSETCMLSPLLQAKPIPPTTGALLRGVVCTSSCLIPRLRVDAQRGLGTALMPGPTPGSAHLDTAQRAAACAGAARGVGRAWRAGLQA